jgi:hypothetical protein
VGLSTNCSAESIYLVQNSAIPPQLSVPPPCQVDAIASTWQGLKFFKLGVIYRVIMTYRGPIQKKVLLLLFAGFALGMTRSVRGQFQIVKSVRKEWQSIDTRALSRAIHSLYASQLIDKRRNKDGTTTFVLSKDGKRLVLMYNIDEIKVKKHDWDGVWRIVIFDIPEKLKKARDSLRYHLKKLGFIELQRSVFIIPYKCREETEYVVEFYNIRRFVRYIEARHLDNELDLKRKFNLL